MWLTWQLGYQSLAGRDTRSAMAELFLSLYCLTLPAKVFIKDLDLFFSYSKTAPKCTVPVCLYSQSVCISWHLMVPRKELSERTGTEIVTKYGIKGIKLSKRLQTGKNNNAKH